MARQAPGGASSICLGLAESELKAVSSNAFASNASQNSGNVLTDRPSTMLHAPPGGYSTICLGGDEAPVIRQSNWTPPGGKSTICLGTDEAPVSSNAFACGASQNSGNVLTDRPTTSLHAPPGGHSTICLAAGACTADRLPRQGGVTAGGQSTVCLGTDASDWMVSSRAVGSARKAMPHETVATEEEEIAQEELSEKDSPEGGVTAGGNSTVCLGTDASDWMVSSRAVGSARKAMPHETVATEEEEIAQEELSEKDSPEAVQNVETCKVKGSDRSRVQELPTPIRARAPPGGAGPPRVPVPAVSVETDRGGDRAPRFLGTVDWQVLRPHIGVALGTTDDNDVMSDEEMARGKSTICLGTDEAPVSSNAFACGASQNSGNVLTDRPTTSLHAPPGGHSTICLAAGACTADRLPPQQGVTAGGQSTVCLGTDASDWMVSSRAVGSARKAMPHETVATEEEEIAQEELSEKDAPEGGVTAGGNSTVCLGTDASDWMVSSRVVGSARKAMPHETVATQEEEIAQEELSEKDSPEAVQNVETCKVKGSDRSRVQELPTPIRARAPPGGVATVLLG
ncbi:unnamed protein product [Effrenium voratum]|uniref:Uncharacterized protein n=1 Tax=Effrenium voratum TaxID=2562239 RepID=A0AA36JB77_9DINO|nr:unnamed protein product [Effrenium voratum]